MHSLKELAQRAAHVAGFHVRRVRSPSIGEEPIRDIKNFALPARPLVLDVGANLGQTVQWVRRELPTSIIHSFEPSPHTFDRLRTAVGDLPDVHLWNMGMGASPGELVLHENSHPDMSSFLELDECGWGTVERHTKVPIQTVDHFCESHDIQQVDVLKSDTQGFDLEVLRGAERMMAQGRISFVYCEIILSSMYKNLPALADILTLLQQRGFRLVTFYRFSYQRGLASWTDALFVHEHVALPDL